MACRGGSGLLQKIRIVGGIVKGIRVENRWARPYEEITSENRLVKTGKTSLLMVSY